MSGKNTRVQTVGDVLRDARLSHSNVDMRALSAVSEALGCSVPHLCYIEADAQPATDDFLLRAADVLEIDAARLLGISGHIDRQLARWAKATPGVPQLLRRIRDTGADPFALLDKVA